MATLIGPHSMTQRGDEVTLRFRSREDALAFFNSNTIRMSPRDPVEEGADLPFYDPKAKS